MTLQRKTRFYVLFFRALIKKQYRNILLGLLLGVFFYFFLPLSFRYLPKPKPMLKIGMVGRFTINEIPEKIQNEISFGLTSFSEKGDVLPSVAESWTILDEGKTYRFKIKNKDFFWHDGGKFSPLDINYNFKDAILSSEGDEIVFRLKDPFSPFPAVVSKPIFKKGLIGIGNYKVKKIGRNGKFIKSISLTPVENKNSPQKVYKFYSTEKDLKTAFNLGEINTIEEIFDKEGISLSKSGTVKEIIRKDAYLAVFFNISNPVFQEKTFRQSLAYAIPKESGEIRALGPISPFSWAYNPDVKPYLQDLPKAKKLLEDNSIHLPEMNFIITTFPQYEKIAQSIKNAWLNLGIKCDVQITTFLPSSFDILLIAREIPNDPDQYYFWHSTQAGNISNFKNPRIDKLLEDGRKIIDREKRKDIYYDFQRFLSEEVPAIFLSHPVTYSVARNSIFQSN